MNGDTELPVASQRFAVNILKGMGLALWALLILVCYDLLVMRLAEWAEERYAVPPWPFILFLGPLLLPLWLCLNFVW